MSPQGPRPDEREALLEAATSAYRERDPRGRMRPSPAWFDLSPEERDALFTLQRESRIVEAAADRRGWSSTVRAVLARVGSAR